MCVQEMAGRIRPHTFTPERRMAVRNPLTTWHTKARCEKYLSAPDNGQALAFVPGRSSHARLTEYDTGQISNTAEFSLEAMLQDLFSQTERRQWNHLTSHPSMTHPQQLKQICQVSFEYIRTGEHSGRHRHQVLHRRYTSSSAEPHSLPLRATGFVPCWWLSL